MNIDQRLEALTQTVELLASLHKDNEKRMERLDQHMEQFATRNLRLEGLVTGIAEGTVRRLHVIEVHEKRISDLEEGGQIQQ
jgi:hypothetical protein